MERISSASAEHRLSDTRMLYQQLRTEFARWAAIPDPQWQALQSIFRARTVRSQAYVFLPGGSGHNLYFVCSGLLRFYYVADDGAESNKAFVAENTFAGALAPFVLDLPVLYGVQALEPTALLTASYADFVALFDQHPVFDRLGRKLTEWLLICKELRTRSLLQEGAADRYRAFVRQYPHLVHRVPQYHIASYLGITEVSLSRLKRSLAQQRPA